MPIAHTSGSLSSPTSLRTFASSESTAIARIATRSPWRFFKSPSQPRVPRQGGHHVAQNSTSTTRPARSSRESVFPSRSVSVIAGKDAISAAVEGAATARESSLRPARMSSIMRERSARSRSWLAALFNGV